MSMGQFLDPSCHSAIHSLQHTVNHNILLMMHASLAQTAEEVLGCIASAGEVVIRVGSMSSSGHDQSRFEAEGLQHRCNATKDFILDAELLGWADFVIMNDLSNAAEVAYFVRRCKYRRSPSTSINGKSGREVMPSLRIPMFWRG